MGRIKSALIKKSAKKLIAGNPGVFSADNNSNKKALDSLVLEKRTRNILAGYITRLMKKK
jgi:ribosomal protein S17E